MPVWSVRSTRQIALTSSTQSPLLPHSMTSLASLASVDFATYLASSRFE